MLADRTAGRVSALAASRGHRVTVAVALLMESGFASKVRDQSWGSYQHEFGGAAGPDMPISVDTDLMRLATGGSAA